MRIENAVFTMMSGCKLGTAGIRGAAEQRACVLCPLRWSNRAGVLKKAEGKTTEPGHELLEGFQRDADARCVVGEYTRTAAGAPSSVVFPRPSFSTQFDNGSGSTSALSSASNTAVSQLAS